LFPSRRRPQQAAKRIFDILDHVSSVPESSNPVHLNDNDRAALSCVNVQFPLRQPRSHQGREINLIIEPGELIGLVGHSGSGKSTLG
jgi:ATP-binding cassette subfamily B protein